jgi:[ribosomal protein S18]-alanine N-acetyltransferase
VTILTRIAAAQDAACLAGIHRECFDTPWSEDSFSRLLERPGAVAILGNDAPVTDVQSFILIEIAADQSEILSIGTLPNARCRGLARVLLREAMTEARRRGAREMFLEVADDNAAALALYSGFGFVPAGRRRAYYSRGGGLAADALTLRAVLASFGSHGNDLGTRLD